MEEKNSTFENKKKKLAVSQILYIKISDTADGTKQTNQPKKTSTRFLEQLCQDIIV